MALGFGRERERGERERRERERRERERRERERRERDKKLDSPFALHAPRHWAI